MDLTHEFTVPATIDETWTALNDIESVAGCFPGAVVTSVEGDTFQGSCKVKLGPIALVYNGTGTFIEKDEASHTMKIQARGKDKRGNGTAGADVVATLVEAGSETAVKVVTELAITGKPAQFGRGVMQDVSDKLLGQFVACLKTKVGTTTDAAHAAAAEAATAAAAAEAGTTGDTSGDISGDTSGDTREAPAVAAPAAQPAAARPAATPPPKQDDALNLGATVLPVLAKAYGKQVAAGIGVIVLVVILWKVLS